MGQLDESYIGRKVYSAAMANNLKNAFGKFVSFCSVFLTENKSSGVVMYF
jgi:hypothetical protein